MMQDLVSFSGEIIQAGSKSFARAAKLFDRDTRASAYLLYAWCRHCDDVIDGQELGFATQKPHDPEAQLQKLRQQTADALAGKPMSDPIFAAFQQVTAKHAIPSQHPYELLDGFAMDVAGRNYQSLNDTLTYCYHVAGVVGVMMAMVMGAKADETLDRASDLGLAFQLTNITRDILDDAKAGRCYLPADWLNEAGISKTELADPKNRKGLFEITQDLLDEADRYYDSALVGMDELPFRSRWAIATARNVYREIGRELRRRGPRAWDSRVSTSKWQKIKAVASGAIIAVFKPKPDQISRQGLWTRPRQH